MYSTGPEDYSTDTAEHCRRIARSQGRGECGRCGDPLPVDGACDCEGDPDRDYVVGFLGLRETRMLVRVGYGLDDVIEVLI